MSLVHWLQLLQRYSHSADFESRGAGSRRLGGAEGFPLLGGLGGWGCPHIRNHAGEEKGEQWDSETGCQGIKNIGKEILLIVFVACDLQLGLHGYCTIQVRSSSLASRSITSFFTRDDRRPASQPPLRCPHYALNS